jgi:thymidylate synthase
MNQMIRKVITKMLVINARNVNAALHEAVYALSTQGLRTQSRNGDVLVFPEPVTTVYANPRERVLFLAERDANPFFHLYESIWMLAGRKDVYSMTSLVKRMVEFSDDGATLPASYGWRWRSHFGEDNLLRVIRELKERPDSRRAFLPMWDPVDDGFDPHRKDYPCNVGVAFQLSAGILRMTVFNRSNDMIWGAYGANAVHMSFLHEYVAAHLNALIGPYTQVSDNMHSYVDVESTKKTFAGIFVRNQACDPYHQGIVVPTRITEIGMFDIDLQRFPLDPYCPMEFVSPWMQTIFAPMMRAWQDYKHLRDPIKAMSHINEEGIDWFLAGREWLARKALR